jgi:hypothetical protein
VVGRGAGSGRMEACSATRRDGHRLLCGRVWRLEGRDAKTTTAIVDIRSREKLQYGRHEIAHSRLCRNINLNTNFDARGDAETAKEQRPGLCVIATEGATRAVRAPRDRPSTCRAFKYIYPVASSLSLNTHHIIIFTHNKTRSFAHTLVCTYILSINTHICPPQCLLSSRRLPSRYATTCNIEFYASTNVHAGCICN